MSLEVDYIIVGQGIAGSCLAYHLIKEGKQVVVFDEFQKFSSSRVAGGIINPITGRKLVKSWMVDDLLPVAKQFYQSIEKEFLVEIYHSIPIYKLFSSVAEQNQWFERSEELGYEKYMSDIQHPSWQNIDAPFGVGEIKNGAWVNTNLFIDTIRKWLKELHVLVEDKFDPKKIAFELKLKYENIIAKHIIFCEGPAALENPYFKYLPFNLAKGELLKVESKSLADLDGLISKNGFLLPHGKHVFSVGATFNWKDLTTATTSVGAIELKEKWNKITNEPFKIIEHKAGIRPTVRDRRPFIGQHPFQPNLYIFNGMGTKGVSLAPFFSNQLIQHIEDDKPLFSEVNISRYEKFIEYN